MKVVCRIVREYDVLNGGGGEPSSREEAVETALAGLTAEIVRALHEDETLGPLTVDVEVIE